MVHSVYKDLKVKKFYSVATESVVADGKTVYKANGKLISQDKYEMIQASRGNITSCTPCILETYDENDKMVSKSVQYQDCNVGFFISYYPNGRIKTIGHYRENDTDVWEPLWDHGYCVKHGTWTDYNEKGKPIKIERYDFGNLK